MSWLSQRYQNDDFALHVEDRSDFRTSVLCVNRWLLLALCIAEIVGALLHAIVGFSGLLDWTIVLSLYPIVGAALFLWLYISYRKQNVHWVCAQLLSVYILIKMIGVILLAIYFSIVSVISVIGIGLVSFQIAFFCIAIVGMFWSVAWYGYRNIFLFLRSLASGLKQNVDRLEKGYQARRWLIILGFANFVLMGFNSNVLLLVANFCLSASLLISSELIKQIDVVVPHPFR